VASSTEPALLHATISHVYCMRTKHGGRLSDRSLIRIENSRDGVLTAGWTVGISWH
jgi:hypothetical protein